MNILTGGWEGQIWDTLPYIRATTAAISMALRSIQSTNMDELFGDDKIGTEFSYYLWRNIL